MNSASVMDCASDPDPMLPRRYLVQRRRRELAGTFTLDLEPLDDPTVPTFAPGQFNMLYVFGVGEIPISISGDPASRTPLVHTIRDVGIVSHALQALGPGDVLGVRGPFGSHWPVERAHDKDLVVVAGGIGLAPLRPVIYAALARRARFGRVALLYGARTPSDILFRGELQRWRTQGGLDVVVTVDRATGSWRGSVGVVTRLIPRVSFDPANTIALVCGPEIMIRFTASELIKRGVPGDSIFISMERNMKCAVAQCGHCQYGPYFVCQDGPVFPYSALQRLLMIWEV
jgi:NAD(P)H-flavin reductase